MASEEWIPNWDALVPRAGSSAARGQTASVGTAVPPVSGASSGAFVPIDFTVPADRGASAGGALVVMTDDQPAGLQTAGLANLEREDLATPARLRMVSFEGQQIAVAPGDSPDVSTAFSVPSGGVRSLGSTPSASRLSGKASSLPTQRESVIAVTGDGGVPSPAVVAINRAAPISGGAAAKTAQGGGVSIGAKPNKTEETIRDILDRFSAAEGALAQKQLAVATAAAKLIVVVPWETATVARLDESKPLPPEKRQAALMRALCAKGVSRLDSLRTSLEKARAYVTAQHGAAAPLFPMSVSFLEVLKVHFEETTGCATAAKQLVDNCELLAELGFDVPSSADVRAALKRPALQKPPPPSGGSARNELGPKLCIDYERASITGRAFGDEGEGTKFLPSGEFAPFHVYAFTRWVKIVGCCRGDDVAGATYEAEPELESLGLIRFVTELDKNKRMNVEHIIYTGGIEVDHHPWALTIASKLASRPLLPAFSFVTGQSKNPLMATGWLGPKNDTSKNECKLAPLGNLTTTKAALARVGDDVAGLSVPQLQADKLRGNHMERHDAPYVVAPLGWPPADQNALGDWSNKEVDASGKAVAAAGHSRSSRRASTFNGSTQVQYRPRAEREVVIRARVRFQRAMRAFIKHFGGYEALSYDTTWAEVVPAVAPSPELEEFYGVAAADSHDAMIAKRATLKRKQGDAQSSVPLLME